MIKRDRQCKVFWHRMAVSLPAWTSSSCTRPNLWVIYHFPDPSAAPAPPFVKRIGWHIGSRLYHAFKQTKSLTHVHELGSHMDEHQ